MRGSCAATRATRMRSRRQIGRRREHRPAASNIPAGSLHRPVRYAIPPDLSLISDTHRASEQNVVTAGAIAVSVIVGNHEAPRDVRGHCGSGVAAAVVARPGRVGFR
jgi:hypothetical protein